jgi:hypothetical protein
MLKVSMETLANMVEDNVGGIEYAHVENCYMDRDSDYPTLNIVVRNNETPGYFPRYILGWEELQKFREGTFNICDAIMFIEEMKNKT